MLPVFIAESYPICDKSPAHILIYESFEDFQIHMSNEWFTISIHRTARLVFIIVVAAVIFFSHCVHYVYFVMSQYHKIN